MPRRVRPPNDAPPFDLIADVHGCFAELDALLGHLGYVHAGKTVEHPQGRRVVLLGDLVDRGPATPRVLEFAMAGEHAGTVLAVVGNHDDKLRRALMGRKVQVKNGLEQSLRQLEGESTAFRRAAAAFIDDLPSHLMLDGGRLVAAHAGLPKRLHGRETDRARDFAMYGETTGRLDSDGLPERLNWAARHDGNAFIAYGHTPVIEPIWQNGTIDIDTGCVFGGRLTALRYPELDLVSVPAFQAYAEKNGPYRVGWPGGERADGVPPPDDTATAVPAAEGAGF